ncbi:MAG TPA: porin family protein [Acidiferrobacteraceae bacterium]|nr:porin family protein [Acidiferrobacteraceae bacterium]
MNTQPKRSPELHRIPLMIATTLVGGILLYMPNPGRAQQTGPTHGGGPYIGAGIGLTKYSDAGIVADACTAFGFSCDADDSDRGLKVFAGYQFGDYIAVEGSYANLGTTRAELPATITTTAEVRTLNLGVVPRFPIGDRAAIFAKAGLSAWYADLTAKSESLGLSESGDGAGTNITFGAGVSYRLNNNVSVRLDWDRYKIDEDVKVDGATVNVGSDIDLFSANISLNF